MESMVYQFDSVSQNTFLSNAGTWNSDSKGPYYYTIIPLEVGKAYKVTLQNVTTLARFRVAQLDSNAYGSAEISIVGYNDTPQNGFSLSFIAKKEYLICYGGTANGGEVLIKSTELMADLTGTTWTFYDTISLLSVSTTFNINFKVLSGEDQTKAFTSISFSSVLSYCYPYAGGTGQIFAYGFGGQAWESDDYKTIKITDGKDVTNADLIAWLESNATLIDAPAPTTATVITYNGSTIATLESGQTATIKTAETEVEHDIVITPAFPIEIAYGDIIATAEAGQTATIKCANTEMEHDIVVSAKAEEEDGVVGTWVFNDTFPSVDTNGRLFLSYANTYEAESFGTLALADGTVIHLGNAVLSSSTGRYFGIQIQCSAQTSPLIQVGKTNAQYSDYDANLSLKGAALTINKPVLYDEGALEWLKANATKQ